LRRASSERKAWCSSPSTAREVWGWLGGFFAGQGREVATLWGMWVALSARGGGLGRQLLAAVADWAREAGADRLRLAVTDCEASAPAAALYRKLGFVETGEREPLEWNPSLVTRVLSRSL
jgi:GNAT superfamily N-acetyltransferase